GLNGNEVIRRLRKVSAMPVIMLTARDAVMDKVSGLDLGADDYVTKPFAIEELLARIRSALRKKQSVKFEAEAEVLHCSGLCLDSARHTVSYNGHKIDLTKREFLMLELLMKNAGIVITRETFIDRIWGWDYVGETNIVDVYIRYLRAKIDEVFGTELISTVRGIGYVLK
ncbi:MAG: response regulator transcription factor, partial [Oscillospiraceae bacterium]